MVPPPKILEALRTLDDKARKRIQAESAQRQEMLDFFGSYRSEGTQMAAKTTAAVAAAAGPATAALYAKQLAAMKSRFDAQKGEAKKGGNDVPTGTYLCRFNKGEIRTFNMKDENKKPITVLGAQMFFKVTDGEQAGETIPKWPKFDTDQGVMYFWRDLHKLGVDIDSYTSEDWPKLMAELTRTKPGVRIKVEWKTADNGKDYQHVYLQQAIKLDDAAADPVAAGSAPVEIEEPDAEPDGATEPDAGEPEPEPVAPPAAVKPKAKAVAAPAAAAGGAKPPKKAAVAAPAPEPDPDEPTAEPEPEPAEAAEEPEPEPAEPSIEAGDPVQYKVKGAVKRGLVTKIVDGYVYVREDNSTQAYRFKDGAGLTKID